jgi:hypothetical protein
MVVLVIGLMLVTVLGIFAYSTIYERRVVRAAWPTFAVGAGVHIAPLKESELLAERLEATRWRAALKRGINHGQMLIDASGIHWSPSRLTGDRVPAFTVKWSEVADYHVKGGPRIMGRRVAQLELTLSDGTPLRFASSNPAGLSEKLKQYTGH